MCKTISLTVAPMPEDLTIRLGLDASGFLNGINSVERNTQTLSQSLAKMATTAQRQIESGFSIMTRLDLVQITVEQSAKRVADAQEKYNQALREFGPHSEQAIAANKELTNATEAQEKAQLRARLTYVLIAGDVVALTAQMPKLVTQVRALTAAQTATAASGVAMAGSLGALTVGLAGVASLAYVGSLAWKGYAADQEKATDTAEGLVAEIERLQGVAKAAAADPGQNMFGDYGANKAAQAEARIAELRERQRSGWIALSEDFFGAERRKADIAAGSESAIRAELDKTLASMQATAAQMGTAADRGEFDALGRKWQALSADAQGYEKQLDAITSKQESELSTSLTQGLRGMGITVAAFSQAFQDDLLIAAGVSEEFVAKMRPLVDVEEMLKNAAGEAGAALRAQAEITAKKDETTADFIARLRELGFTEDEIKNRVDATGRSLRSQAQMTDKATEALIRFNGTGPNGAVSQAPNLLDIIQSNKDFILKQTLGSMKETSGPHAGKQKYRGHMYEYWADHFNAENILGLFDGSYTGGTGANAMVPGMTKASLQPILTRLIQANSGSWDWDKMLRQLGVTQLAHGMDGIVRKPTLFMAGEQGPEHVVARPLVRGSITQGGGGVTIYGGVHVNAPQARNGREVSDALMRELRSLGVHG